MGDFYTLADGTYLPVSNGVDKFAPATFSEEVAEDPRLRAVPEVPGADPRMQSVMCAGSTKMLDTTGTGGPWTAQTAVRLDCPAKGEQPPNR